MATTAKRPSGKSTVRKNVRKLAARKPAARKKAAAKKTPKRAAPARKAAKATKTKKITKATKAAKPTKATKTTKVAKTTQITKSAKATKANTARKSPPVAAPKSKPAKQESRNLSPEAKKNLAAKHLWELVEEKKRRAAQPPAWQNIGHHDHTAPGSTTVQTTTPNAEPEKFHIGSHLDRGGS